MVIVRPLKDQPPKGYIDNDVSCNIISYSYLGSTADQEYPVYPLPYTLKQRIGLREPWWYCKVSGYYYYKSDCKRPVWITNKSDKNFRYDGGYDLCFVMKQENGHWHSSATMPADAIRHYFIPEKFEVKRVVVYALELQLHTHPHSLSTYLAFKYDWNDRYAKPRKRKGEWVCYPWDMSIDILEKYKYVEWGFKHKEPLTIHANAYVLVMEGRIE